MKARFIALFSALALLLGISLFAAPAANAGTCTVAGPVVLCGKVYNRTDITVRVVDNWPAAYGNVQAVPPGSNSTFRDTDGFYLPPGRCFGLSRGPIWIKIADTSQIELNNVNFFRC